jgi:selenophosphate synthetase-related protein
VLAELADDGLCRAAKDISMGGVLGTLLMLMECSEIAANVRLDRIPIATQASLERWLVSFPSFGYLLAVAPEFVDAVRQRFGRRGIACAAFGTCLPGSALTVELAGEREVFWDLAGSPFTGAAADALV